MVVIGVAPGNCGVGFSLSSSWVSCIIPWLLGILKHSVSRFSGYKPRFVHTRPSRSLSVEFEGQIYDIDLQADDKTALRPRNISKRHYEQEEEEGEELDFDPESDDGSEEMLADDTNAIGYPNSVKVTHK